MEEFVFGSWYVCWGTKPVQAQTAHFPNEPEQLIAAE